MRMNFFNAKFLILFTIILISCKTDDYDLQYFYNDPNEPGLLKYCGNSSINSKSSIPFCVDCINGLVGLPGGYCTLEQVPDYCIGIDVHLSCQVCGKGYYIGWNLTYPNFCKSKKIGCVVFDYTKEICLTCQSGWILNTTINFFTGLAENYCYLTPDPNCQQIASDNITCLQCKPNFIMENGTRCNIQALLSNCQTMNGSICKVCVTDYQVNKYGACDPIPKINFCDSQINFTCTKCSTNYQINSKGGCDLIPKISNCNIQIDHTCSKCFTNYQLNSIGGCDSIPKIINCISQIDYSCQICATNFQLNKQQTCQPIPKISFCEIQVNYTCTKCLTNYQLNPSSICDAIPKITNCDTQVDYNCTKCLSNYQLNSISGCDLIPSIPYCSSQINTNCSKCISYYVLSNNSCTPIIPNCMEINSTTGACNKCNNFYMNILGKCYGVVKVLNCKEQYNLSCSKCNDGYTLFSGYCPITVSNCINYSLLNTCSQCSSNFVLNPIKNYCQLSIAQEQSISPQNWDSNCKNFSLNNSCLVCSEGFYLNTNNTKLCQQIDPLCQTYNQANGYCLSCYVGYSLNLLQGKCQKTLVVNALLNNCNVFDYTKNTCTKCINGALKDQSGICQKYLDIYCKVPSSDLLSCQQCYIGYIYDSILQKCVTSAYNCATYILGKCATCSVGNYLDTNLNCTQIDIFCKQYNSLTKKCQLCYAGYGLDSDGICKTFSKLSTDIQKYYLYCLSFNGTNNQCTKCISGYYLIQDKIGYYCTQGQTNCRSNDEKTGLCLTCYLGYYFRDGKCTLIYKY